MDDESTEPRWRTVALIAAFGGVGGVTAWVWSITIGTPLDLGVAAAVAANVFLGVVAGFIGVFAIKLDSSRVLMHTLAIALLCGFAWKPVLEAGRELVVTRIQDAEAERQIETAQQSIEMLREADTATAAIVIDDLVQVSTELIRSSNAIRSPALRSEASRVVAQSVAALNEAAAVAPEAAARGLGSIGAVALTGGQTRVSAMTSDVLVRLADRPDLDVGASAEVSNSLMQLSDAASALREPEQSESLRALSVEAFEQAQRRVEGNPQLERELRNRAAVTREGLQLQRVTP